MTIRYIPSNAASLFPVPLPSLPGCFFTESQIIVFVVKGIVALSGVNIRIVRDYASDFTGITGFNGIKTFCSFVNIKTVYIQKNGEDFGKGISKEYEIGGYPSDAQARDTLVYFANAKAPVLDLPCLGTIVPPDISKLSNLLTPPTSFTIPITITGTSKIIPVQIYIDDNLILTQNSGTSFDLISKLKSINLLDDKTHTLEFYVPLEICKIPPVILTIPSLIPKIPECLKFITTADTPSHPTEITDPFSTFYLYIHNLKQACQSDSNIASIPLPKGTPVNIKLGNLPAIEIPLTSDGVLDEDLSKLFDLKKLIPI